jgi:hypothetical protein
MAHFIIENLTSGHVRLVAIGNDGVDANRDLTPSEAEDAMADGWEIGLEVAS